MNNDQQCQCGHLHSKHGPSGSINYSAGRCTIENCKCAHFLITTTPSTLSPEIGDGGGVGQLPPGQVWDLSHIAESQKYEFVDGMVKITAENFLKVFIMLGLKDGIHSNIVNEATGDHFYLSFKKTPAPSTETSATGDVPAEVIKLCQTIAKEVCPNEVYGSCPSDWEKSKAREEYIEGAKNGAFAMYQRKEQEIIQLKASLEESRNDAKVFQEWYRRGDENIIKVTEEAADYRKLLDELFPGLSLEEKEAVAPVLDKYTKK